MTLTLTHAAIDRRLRRLVEACALKIDRDQRLLEKARSQVLRWTDPTLKSEWQELLAKPWPELRATVLEDSQEGDRRRQSVPFAGILTNEERFRILRS